MMTTEEFDTAIAELGGVMPDPIQEGAYLIPEGCTAVKKGNILEIRPSRKKVINDLRCRDCKFYGEGYTSKFGNKTTVCLGKPKKGKHGYFDVPLYYMAHYNGALCDKFEKIKP